MIAYVQTASGVLIATPGLLAPFLFAGASGALAVGSALLAATLWRRAAAARDKLALLEAQIQADLSAEKVFLLRHDRLAPASPATEAYVRDIAISGDTPPEKLALRAILGDESTRLLGPLIRGLLNSGAAFSVAGRDAAGAPWRFVGETVGASAVLRLLPPERDDAVDERGETVEAEAAAEARSEAEAAKAALAAWRETLDQAPIGVAIFDSEGRLEAMNALAARLWRLDVDFAESRATLRALLDALRHKGRLPERTDYAGWRAEMIDDPADALAREPRWPLPNGDTLQVTAAASPTGGFALFVSDETSALGLDRRYKTALGARQAMITALDVGLAVVGADGAVQLVNPTFAKLWSLDHSLSDERGAGQAALADIAEKASGDSDDAEIWSRISASVSTAPGAPRRIERFTAARAGGARHEIQTTPLPDGATLISCADVTDAHRAEMALREKAEALETADQLKTDFLNDIAYQLRTPLNAVIGFADMLRQGMAGDLKPKQTEYLDNVLTAANDLRELIRDALDLGALRAGAVTLRDDSVDLNRVALSLAALIGPRAKRQGASLETALARTPLRMKGDEARLKHALFSAASAVMNASTTGDRLRLSLEPDGHSALLSLRLERRGAKGVDIEGLEEVGGVALSLARRIAEMHGGAVAIERGPASTQGGREPGYSAQAVFRLPLERRAPSAEPAARRTAS